MCTPVTIPEQSLLPCLPLVIWYPIHFKGGEWYLEKRESQKILPRSRHLTSIFDKSRSLLFFMVCFYFFESRKFSPKGLGLGFLTRILGSRRVSDFTIRHPTFLFLLFDPSLNTSWSQWILQVFYFFLGPLCYICHALFCFITSTMQIQTVYSLNFHCNN